MFFKIKPAIRLNLFLITLLAGASAISQEIGDFQPEEAWDGNPDINGIWQAIGTIGIFRTMKQAQVYPKWVLSVRFLR